MADVAPSILPHLREAVAVVMLEPFDAITAETRFTDLGADSLDQVEICLRLEEISGARLADDLEQFFCITVGDTARKIDAWLNGCLLPQVNGAPA